MNRQKSGSQNGNDDSDDDSDREDQELPSLESVASDGSSELSLVLNSPNVRSPIHGNGENGGHLSFLRSPNPAFISDTTSISPIDPDRIYGYG